jgi:hypothetical protein
MPHGRVYRQQLTVKRGVPGLCRRQLLRKECQWMPCWFSSCCRTPPMWESDASTARERVAPGVGCESGTAATRAALTAENTSAAAADQSSDLGLPRSRSVSGLRSQKSSAETYGKN